MDHANDRLGANLAFSLTGDYDHQDYHEGRQQGEEPYDNKKPWSRGAWKTLINKAMTKKNNENNTKRRENLKYDKKSKIPKWSRKHRGEMISNEKLSRWRREHRDTNIKMTEKGIEKKSQSTNMSVKR